MKKLIFLLCLLPALRVIGQNPPDISLIFYIDENSDNNTLIGIVSATDPDGDPLTYAITSGNDAGAFAMEATSGELRVADVSQLDYETTPSFTLMVEADDGNGGMTTVSITINLNDIDEDVLSIGDNDDPVSVYPNPVGEVLAIDLGVIKRDGLEIAIYSLGGVRIPLEANFVSDSKVEIDAALFSEGLYLVKIKNGESVRTFPIRKN